MKNLTFVISLLGLWTSMTFANVCVMADFDEQVINTGATLKEIEQEELTRDSCEIYTKEFKRRKTKKPALDEVQFIRSKVLCGKWMFINLGMRTDIGIPTKIVEAIEQFPEVGKKFKQLGFIDDASRSDKKYPFGVVPARHNKKFAFKRLATNKIVQISCAACHTGQLNDGRYSIGASNEKLQYGKFNIYTLFSIWLFDKKKNNQERWLPELIELYEELAKQTQNKFLKNLKKMASLPGNSFFLKNVIGEEPPPLSTQRSFLKSQAGIYNGFSPSINFTDLEIYTVAPQLWEIGRYDEAHYGSLAGHSSVDQFIQEAFIYTNRHNKSSNEMMTGPVKEYLKCLKAPKNFKQIKPELMLKGQILFSQNCMSCHDRKHGGGSLAVDAKEVNFPEEYLNLFRNYQPSEVQSNKTYKLISDKHLINQNSSVKVKRLNGFWTRENLTTTGKIKSVNQLFCLENETRPKNSIHSDLCFNYSKEDKLALIEFLEHF